MINCDYRNYHAEIKVEDQHTVVRYHLKRKNPEDVLSAVGHKLNKLIVSSRKQSPKTDVN